MKYFSRLYTLESGLDRGIPLGFLHLGPLKLEHALVQSGLQIEY